MTDLSDRAAKSHISVHAAAKINLFLHVTGRRPDGYHELDSLVGFTEFGDRVSVECAEDISLKIDGPFGYGLPVDDGNLVLKAASTLARDTGHPGGARITLQKNLPASSGIGGGSADAAATLRALNELWQVDLSPEKLAQIGLTLGADVPVCLSSRTARMSGIGEIVRPVRPLPDLGVLLINPGVPVSTPEVFKSRRGIFSDIVREVVPEDPMEFVAFLRSRKNDLQEAASVLVPDIAEILEALSAQSGCQMARLSGSGATCFGLFDDQDAAEEAGRTLSGQHVNWWCQPTRFLA